MVFHDHEYEIRPPATLTMDVHIAVFRKDSLEVPLHSVQKGDEVTAVSYAEEIRKMKQVAGEQGQSLSRRLPDPAPVDEVYIKHTATDQPEDKPAAKTETATMSLKKMALTGAVIFAVAILVMFALPSLVFLYYLLRHTRAKASGSKSYWAYRAATFFLHQSGIFRGDSTPMRYARSVVDPKLGTSFTAFMNVYLKQKYADQTLSEQEGQTVRKFLKPFLRTARQKISRGQRLAGFLNPLRALSYFMQGEEDR